MKFGTNDERMQHPLASAIPKNLWESNVFFAEELPDELIPLMQAKTKLDILELLDETSLNEDDQKACAWLAIALTHQSFGFPILKEISHILGITNQLLFYSVASWGNTEFLRDLMEDYSIKELLEIITNEKCKVYRKAAFYSLLDILKYFEEKAPDSQQMMIAACDYEVFREAACAGRLDIIRYLEEKAPDFLKTMIAAREYQAFRWAAYTYRFDILHYLDEKAPEHRQAMIAASDYEAFREAASQGYLDLLKYLDEKAPEHIQAMIAAWNYSAFRDAASNGHLAVLEYLAEKDPEHLEDMIATYDYAAFQNAASAGYLHILKYLAEKNPEQLHAMIAANNYSAFQGAASNGHLDVLKYLEKIAPEYLEDMIVAYNYIAFRGAACAGYINILKYLAEKAPEHLQEMIRTHEYEAFREAASAGYLEVIIYLEDKVSVNLEDMIEACEYEAFRACASSMHRSVINHLLSHFQIFAFAEQHVYEYEDDVHPFIAQKIQKLREQKNAEEQANPNTVFDILDPKEAKLLFYIVRNLIRRNDPQLNDDLLLLLGIPSVKALAHIALTLHQPNELLRLAYAQGNQAAAALLLTIPAVRQLAEQNNYYLDESNGMLDLHAFVENRESSMTALTHGENQRLQEALDHYYPQLVEIGINRIMADLRKILELRYKESSASIFLESTGTNLLLPLDWAEFQKVNLTKYEREKAIKSYYRNKDHTVWRYLLKPNPWMHPEASFVNVNPQNPNEKWSTFEEHQFLICLFFLASKDEEISPTEGFTLSTRLEHFIDELALIGRAHNWDKMRIKQDSQGNSILDENNKFVKEEFDDLEGDRPSCFSGVKRRIFQSVLGHPLLNLFTKEKLEEEIRGFVRQYWQDAIEAFDYELIHATWEKIIEGEKLEKADWDVLRFLDIPEQKQQQFIQYLTDKYGKQFSSETLFIKYIQQTFHLKTEHDAHLIKFGYLHPEQFFSKKAHKATLQTLAKHPSLS